MLRSRESPRRRPPTRCARSRPSCSASEGRSPTFKTGLGALATVDEKQGRRAGGQRGDDCRDRRARCNVGASWPRPSVCVQLAAERLDLTEVMSRPRRGHAHVVTQAWERLEDVFIGLGFQVAEGPRGRDRLVQLRGAQHARRPPGAQHARHVLPRVGRARHDGAAHAHLDRCRSA